MKFLLLVYLEENALTERQRQDCYEESTELCRELHGQGRFFGASPLQPISTAASVRVREGKPLVTDGPFAETREQLGGYFLVEASDREEAIAIAARIPAARDGTIEVRPIVELPGLPLGPEPLFASRS
ncbi:YciI family protein [Aquisphaera insulae]|uniref:YciI family protein n=1 Tax=Aquisphaera insulae TaxID=2712864 RepID=UPI0013ED8DF2|nr:YciI family protein [Aquisphaera insulae]